VIILPKKVNKQAEEVPQKPNLKLKFKKIIRIVLISVAALFILGQFFLEQVMRNIGVSGNYGLEMVMIFPAVLILMGLADVWVPKEEIEHYLGDKSGIKGFFWPRSWGLSLQARYTLLFL